MELSDDEREDFLWGYNERSTNETKLKTQTSDEEREKKRKEKEKYANFDLIIRVRVGWHNEAEDVSKAACNEDFELLVFVVGRESRARDEIQGEFLKSLGVVPRIILELEFLEILVQVLFLVVVVVVFCESKEKR